MKDRIKAKGRYFIQKVIDVPVTKKKFLKHQEIIFRQEHLAKDFLLKNKIFTLREVDIYEKEGLLKVMVFKRKKFYKKSDINKIPIEKIAVRQASLSFF